MTEPVVPEEGLEQAPGGEHSRVGTRRRGELHGRRQPVLGSAAREG
jgi:hypothetical protein